MSLRQRPHDHLVRLRTAAVHEHVFSVVGQHHRVTALPRSRRCPTRHESRRRTSTRCRRLCRRNIWSVRRWSRLGPTQLGRHEVVAADTPRVGRQDSAVDARPARFALRQLTRHTAELTLTLAHSGRLTLAVTATDVADAARTDVVARLATGVDVTLARDAVRRPVHASSALWRQPLRI